jgi:hypothetical protein
MGNDEGIGITPGDARPPTPILRAALADSAAAGLYRLGSRISAAMVRREAGAAGRLYLPIDGTGIASKREFLIACARAARFPAYVGRNWDALEEALRDLSWLARPGLRGYVVLLDPAAPFIRHAPADWAVARAVFQSAIDFWRASPTPLTVLLRRAGGLAGGIPLLEAVDSGAELRASAPPEMC